MSLCIINSNTTGITANLNLKGSINILVACIQPGYAIVWEQARLRDGLSVSLKLA